MKKGKYIVFEGIDGCGKSTQSKSLAAWLAAKMLDVKVDLTREPGSHLVKPKFDLRPLLLSTTPLSKPALELLLQADRAEHTSIIKGMLDEGWWFVADRSYITGMSYAEANGNDVKTLEIILRFAIQAIPDLVFLLDIPFKEAEKRWPPPAERTREELLGEPHYERVRNNFRQFTKQFNLPMPAHYVVLDATKPVAELESEVQAKVQEVFGIS
jgi:dTMP kinase